LDNNNENYYIQITLDGLIKVSEQERAEALDRVSKLLKEILQTNGIVSSKANINVISELEVMSVVSDSDSFN
jgi:hypothetical protein